MNSRSPRSTYVETGRTVKVTLEHLPSGLLGRPYRLAKITNEIAVVVTNTDKPNKPVTRTLHVGDYFSEEEATDLLTEPGLEITTVPAKK